MNFRIGYGYDVHQLAEGYEFWLGGIKVPHTKGSVGHSDGDVLIHAICDALFGAANLGDIGKHFPDTSNEYKGIDSKILLKRTYDILLENGYQIGNIDSTICLQKPKIRPYIEKMQSVLAKTLNIDAQKISVKTTSTEKLGFVGQEEGISAHAMVLIHSD